MRKCFTLYAVRKPEMETTVRQHWTSMRKAKARNTDTTKCWWSRGLQSPTGMHDGTATRGQTAASCKLGLLLPCDPAVLFLGIYAKEPKTYAHIKAHTWMFTAALFILVKTGKQPICQSSEERITVQGNTFHNSKETSYQATEDMRTLKAHY